MYIKLKHIKQFLLVFTCLLLIGFNYFHFVKADNNSTTKCDTSIDSDCDGLTNDEEKLYGTDPNNADTGNCGYSDGVNVKAGYNPLTCKKFNTNNLVENSIADSTTYTNSTSDFTQKLQEFINSKGSDSISSSEIQDFVSQQLNSQSNIEIANIPAVDKTQLNIIDQTYSNLSVEDKKQKIKEDTAKYLVDVAYILVSNAPEPITSPEEFNAFQDNFLSHIQTLSSQNPDYTYFNDLGNRLELIRQQINTIKVPATIADLHIKFVQLIDACLSLRNISISPTDYMSQLILAKNITSVVNLANDFFSNDVSTYFSQFN